VKSIIVVPIIIAFVTASMHKDYDKEFGITAISQAVWVGKGIAV